MSDAELRRYCRKKGLKGKDKKRLRRVLKERRKQKASAINALVAKHVEGATAHA